VPKKPAGARSFFGRSGAALSGATGERSSKLVAGARLVQAASASALALSFIFGVGSLPKMDLCLFHATTGLQCPGCGMTRAFCAISHGQFSLAWGLNPVSFHIYALAVLGLAYPFFVNAVPERLVRGTALATATALMVLGIWRVCAGVA
jgi:hypothetical protein